MSNEFDFNNNENQTDNLNQQPSGQNNTFDQDGSYRMNFQQDNQSQSGGQAADDPYGTAQTTDSAYTGPEQTGDSQSDEAPRGSQEPDYNHQYQQSGQSSNPYEHYYQNTDPMNDYNVTPSSGKPKKKKSGGAKKAAIAVACVACIAVGGLGGAGVVSSLSANKAAPAATTTAQSTATAQTPTKTPETTAEAAVAASDDSNINKTTLNVTTNSTDSNLTPQDVYEKYVNAVVAIKNTSTASVPYFGTYESVGSGSGFIISADGYILTNNHVVEGAQSLEVSLTSGETYDAKVIGADADNDVALIKIEASDLPTVSIGDSNNISVGEQVCAIGNPLGELTNTLTVGYVSALDRSIVEDSETGATVNMFQTDCAINNGNSGGPLFDMNGNVIGITSAKFSSSGSSSTTATIEGIGFCIPVNDAMSIAEDILKYGEVKSVVLGIYYENTDDAITSKYNMPAGVGVTSVVPGSAAEKGGIQKGDIITAIDGKDVSTYSDLKYQLKNYAVGDSVEISIYRASTLERKTVTVTFAEETTSNTTQAQTPEQGANDGTQSETNPYGGGYGNFFDFYNNSNGNSNAATEEPAA